MTTILIYVGAALAEIGGCFAFWAWARMEKSIFWLPFGVVALVIFAYFLSLTDSDAAGRAYAVYGGIYIVISLIWLWIIEGIRPDRWDLIGAAICLIGASIILFVPRAN